jgi:hypothetical protein
MTAMLGVLIFNFLIIPHLSNSPGSGSCEEELNSGTNPNYELPPIVVPFLKLELLPEQPQEQVAGNPGHYVVGFDYIPSATAQSIPWLQLMA